MQMVIQAVGSHLIAFLLALVLLAAFTWLYKWFTPYDELKEIRDGKVAPAISIVGAMVGFTIPLIAAMFVAMNIPGFLLWALIVCAIQLICFKILYWILPNQIESNNIAAAVFYAGASVCVGALNAVCIIP